MCDCGCGTCSAQKPVVLNENLAPKAILSEGLKYHMDNARPLTEHVYRAGSENYFNLWAEARALYARNILEVQGDDLEVLTETDLGHFGIVDGKKVPLDFPIELTEAELGDFPFEYKGFKYNVEDTGGMVDDYGKKVWQVSVQDKDGDVETMNVRGARDGHAHQEAKDFIEDVLLPYYGLEEAKKKAKKNTKKLNKPMRDSSGGKAYKVYVKDPKTKNIKTIRFGSGGLRAKINDKKARNAFAARHKCAQKKDKTKAGYWSCRLPRYAKLLGLKSNFGGFW